MSFTQRDDEPATATATAMPESPEPESNAQARRAHAPAREEEFNTERDPVKKRHAEEFWPERVETWLSRAQNRTWMSAPPARLGEIWGDVADRADDVEGILPKFGCYLAGGLGWLASAPVYCLTYPVTGLLGAGWMPSLLGLIDAIEETVSDPLILVRLALTSAWLWVAACYGIAYLVRDASLLVMLAFCWGVAYLTTLI